MRDHSHCCCDDDRIDWRRGRCEPAESPEAEQTINRRRNGRRVQEPKLRRTITRRHI